MRIIIPYNNSDILRLRRSVLLIEIDNTAADAAGFAPIDVRVDQVSHRSCALPHSMKSRQSFRGYIALMHFLPVEPGYR